MVTRFRQQTVQNQVKHLYHMTERFTLYAKWEAVESNNIKIVDQPVDKTVEEGMTTSFTVKAEGGGLSYQWQYKNGRKLLHGPDWIRQRKH